MPLTAAMPWCWSRTRAKRIWKRSTCPERSRNLSRSSRERGLVSPLVVLEDRHRSQVMFRCLPAALLVVLLAETSVLAATPAIRLDTSKGQSTILVTGLDSATRTKLASLDSDLKSGAASRWPTVFAVHVDQP